jgi:hypothetical protein
VGGLIASGIFCIPNVYVWLIVRLVIGFMSGVRLVATARFIEETLPQQLFAPLISVLYFTCSFGENV